MSFGEYRRFRLRAWRFELWRSNLALALFLLALAFVLTGCPKNNPRRSSSMKTAPPTETQPAVVPGAVAFNGERAMDHVKKQMDIGPRVPGSPELAKMREYIVGSLKRSGLTVRQDEFVATTPLGEKKMVNLTAEIPGESKDVVMISSHYDSKFYKDMHFVGANDPGTSVGTLLEMARVLITSGDLSGALARLKKAAELTPSAPAVHYQLGTLYRRMGQNDDAERHLNLFRQLQAEQARQAGSDAKPLR